jgi:hypothetical protein
MRAARAMGSPPPLQSQSPPAFSLEHATHGLSALGRTEPLGGTAATALEALVASRAVATRFQAVFCWALTLAGTRVLAGRLGVVRPVWVILPSATLGQPTPIRLALGLSRDATVGGLTIALAGSPVSPLLRRVATIGTTVPGLGMGGAKEVATPLQQTKPAPGPTRPLTVVAAGTSLNWAQGSVNFRRPSLGRGVLLTPLRGASTGHSALLADPNHQVMTGRSDAQPGIGTQPVRRYSGISPRHILRRQSGNVGDRC